ncbi:transporter substrate-binding domain-containing protein [Ferrovibrio sp. MS7]|uniref:substrate-binding periplasmic protein n=1 Tax=Ferrovibrio plantarum TaxID=3119164 RepID=UPI0031352D24
MLRRLLLLLPLLLAAAPVPAAEPLRLVTGTDYPPFADPKLPDGGALTELVRAAFSASGRETSIAYTSWNRALEETKLGRYDAALPYVPSPERASSFFFSSALFNIDTYVLSSSERDAAVKAIGPGMPGPRACLPLGWTPQPALRALLENGTARQIETTAAASCLKMIQAGRVDFFVVSKPVGWHLMRSEELPRRLFRFSDQPLSRSTLHLMVSRSRIGGESLLAEFEQGMERISKNGIATNILARHGLLE